MFYSNLEGKWSWAGTAGHPEIDLNPDPSQSLLGWLQHSTYVAAYKCERMFGGS